MLLFNMVSGYGKWWPLSPFNADLQYMVWKVSKWLRFGLGVFRLYVTLNVGSLKLIQPFTSTLGALQATRW